MQGARTSDEALSLAELKCPLHGVPITIKDILDTAGIVGASETKGRKGFVPKQAVSATRGLISSRDPQAFFAG